MSAPLALSLLILSASPPQKALGINLDFHRSWASHLMFVDAIKRARPWIPFVPGSDVFDSGAKVPVDETGMPLEVPFTPPEGGPRQLVRTLLFEELSGRYPRGRYVLEFKGSGTLELSGDAGRRVFRRPGRYLLDVRPTSAGLRIEILRSLKRDPIRDMHLWLPGFEGSKEVIHPEFVTRLKGFAVLRPAQTMSINGGDYPCDNLVAAHDPKCVQGWSSRTTPQSFTQSVPRGVAIEYLVEVANRAEADLWPGIPHAVDDEWVRQMAIVLRNELAPERRVYVELSNEIWNFNGHYPQHDYFRAIGRASRMFARDLADDDTDAGRRAFVKRSIEVWQIFEDVFGRSARRRVVKVMPGFFGNPWHSERMLGHLSDRSLNPRRLRADALAVGAYFGGPVGNALVAEGRSKSATIDMVLDRAEASLGSPNDAPKLETFASLTRAHVALARRNRLPLIAYEGGQHLVIGTGEPSPINQTLQAANRDPRMAHLYDRMFDLWFGLGGGLFIPYSFVDRHSRYGFFGHLEYMHQPLEDAPKFQALRARMQAFGAELPRPRLRLPLGRSWSYIPTGTFPGTGILIPVSPKDDDS